MDCDFLLQPEDFYVKVQEKFFQENPKDVTLLYCRVYRLSLALTTKVTICKNSQRVLRSGCQSATTTQSPTQSPESK